MSVTILKKLHCVCVCTLKPHTIDMHRVSAWVILVTYGRYCSWHEGPPFPLHGCGREVCYGHHLSMWIIIPQSPIWVLLIPKIARLVSSTDFAAIDEMLMKDTNYASFFWGFSAVVVPLPWMILCQPAELNVDIVEAHSFSLHWKKCYNSRPFVTRNKF